MALGCERWQYRANDASSTDIGTVLVNTGWTSPPLPPVDTFATIAQEIIYLGGQALHSLYVTSAVRHPNAGRYVCNGRRCLPALIDMSDVVAAVWLQLEQHAAMASQSLLMLVINCEYDA